MGTAQLLLERETDLGTIDAAVADVVGGGSRLVVIEGSAGIGKTSLLAELRRSAAEAGLTVLWARGRQLEGEFAYGVVRQLFEEPLTDPQVRARWLDRAAAPARAVFEASGTEEQDAGFAILHALYWLTANAAGDGPLVLAVDDLHWVDRPSLRFLAYLAGRLEGMPLLLAVTLRTAETGLDVALIGDVVADPGATVLTPTPLSPEGTAELIAGRLGAPSEPEFTDACRGASGGNPLLLGQLLRTLGDDAVRPLAGNAVLVREIGPRAVSRTVLLRLARLPADATAVARAVAVLGERSDVPTVAAISGIPEERVAAAVDALARTEILGPGAPLAFVHALVRDAVHGDMSPAQREMLHTRAAAVLRRTGADPEQVAAHLLAVPRRGDPEVVATLRAAAHAATARSADDTAAILLRRALEEPPPPHEREQVVLELALAMTQLDSATAMSYAREAYETHPDPAGRVAAGRALAWMLLFEGGAAEAARIAEDLEERLGPDQDDLRGAVRAIRLLSPHFGATDPAIPPLAVEHRGDLSPVGPGAHGLAGVAAFSWMLRGGGATECAALARAALRDGVIYRGVDGFLTSPCPLIVLDLGEAPDAEAAWRAATAEAHRQGSDFAISGILLWRGRCLLARGDLPEATRFLEEAHAVVSRWGLGAHPQQAAYLASTRVLAGDPDGARAAVAGVRSVRDSDGEIVLAQAAAEIALAEGDPESALAKVAEMRRALAARGLMDATNPVWWPWRSLEAQALDALGRTTEALPLLETELEWARAWGTPGGVGRTLRVLGEVRREEGLGDLEEAVRLLAGSTARLEHALALVALGRRLRLDRRPTEAREPLREALALAESCGAEGLVETARGELLATGARPRTSALSGPDSLTPSERRVVALAVEGRTNRDIAQELYVTLKTVEVHLSNAYRKLGVRSRRELPSAMGAEEG